MSSGRVLLLIVFLPLVSLFCGAKHRKNACYCNPSLLYSKRDMELRLHSARLLDFVAAAPDQVQKDDWTLLSLVNRTNRSFDGMCHCA